MGATMSRAGRKRKTGAIRGAGWRERSEDPAVLTKWNRARDNFLAFGADPILASQAGKLFAFHDLSAFELEAAKRWCVLLTTYDRVILNMARSTRGSALERAGQSLAQEHDPEWIAAFRERFDAAQDAVLAAGRPALTALNRLCRDEAASSVLLESRKGLAALVAYFRLEPPKGT
jgi:hypothetical protein